MGAEWWMRRRKISPIEQTDALDPTIPTSSDEIQGVVKARFSSCAVSEVSDQYQFDTVSEKKKNYRTSHFFGKVGSGML